MPYIYRTHPVLAHSAALLLAAPLFLILSSQAEAQAGSICVECHKQVTPGIMEQWQKGKMGAKVDCSICHGSEHKDATDASKALMPTPGTCRLCHSKQVDSYLDGKHAPPWTAMKTLPLLDQQL
jgi:hydroxylamine dehydrogenase